MQLTAKVQWFIITGALLITGCAQTPVRPVDALAAEVGYTAQRKTEKTLTVAPVKWKNKRGGSVWEPQGPDISEAELGNLLVGALRKSGLFREVTGAQGGDYRLYVEIAYEDHVPGLTSTEILMVHYLLQKGDSGRPLWKRNIFTQMEMSYQEVFVGQQRAIRLFEKALVENIRLAIEQLERALENETGS